MTWLYPSFLWALFFLTIPVVIHLFNFRRYKKIEFTNVRFLKHISTETKSGNQLKRFLILCSRLLALTFLVFAFAQPIFLEKKQNNAVNYISIVLDNSYSMNSSGKEGNNLEAAKNRARAIVSKSSNQDKFQIITSQLDPSLLHFFGKEETLENIDKIKAEPETYPLSTLLETQNRLLLKTNGNKQSFVISDFQKNLNSISKRIVDSSIQMSFLKVDGSKIDNISIDSCYLISPIIQKGQSIGLAVVLSNYSENNIEDINVELYVNKKPKGILAFNIAPYSKVTQVLNFTIEDGGLHACELKLSGDNIPLDDQLFFSLKLKENYQILHISESNNLYINALYKDNPGFILKEMNKGAINFNQFNSNDLIILNELDNISSGLIAELKKYISAGGSVMIFPKNIAFGGLKNLSTEFSFNVQEQIQNQNLKVSYLDNEHPIFKNTFSKKNLNPDLPLVNKNFNIQYNNGVSLLKLSNGQSFLHDILFKNGHLYICAAPLNNEYSNFQNNALFVPIMLKTAINNQQKGNLYQIIGNNEPIYTGLNYESEQNLFLAKEQNKIVPEFINKNGELFIGETSEIKIPGHYELQKKGKDTALLNIAFNINRTESDTRMLSNDEIKEMAEQFNIQYYFESAEQFSSEYLKIKKGSSLWKWCIFFVLFFLLIEILLIRFFQPHVKSTF